MKPGAALQTPLSFSNSLIKLWFGKISLRHRHALIVEDGAFSHEIGYVTIFRDILDLKGHPNRNAGSKVTAILLNGCNLPVGGVASGRVCAQDCFPISTLRRLNHLEVKFKLQIVSV